MAIPDLTLIDRREVAPGRYRALVRLNDHAQAEVRWFVTEVGRLIDCGMDWALAVELLAVPVLPAKARPRVRRDRVDVVW